MFGFKACPHPYPYLKTQVGQIFIFQQSRHKASLRVSASANFKSLCVTRFNLKTDGLRPYYASFVFEGNYCPSCCWWSLSSAEVPAGYPYKNSNNRKKKRAGDDEQEENLLLLSPPPLKRSRASCRSFVHGPLTSIQATADRFQLKKWG